MNEIRRASGGTEQASIGFLISDAVLSLTDVITNARDDNQAIDLEVSYIDAMAAYYTEKDKEFGKEIAAALEKKEKDKFKDAVTDLDYQMTRFRAIIKSCCRQGLLVRNQSANDEWNPAEGVEA